MAQSSHKYRDRSAQALAKRVAQKLKRVVHDKVASLPLSVNVDLLRPDNSYALPDFVQRGSYVDRQFTCKDCDKTDLWTATQQKSWYEVAKGGVWTTATRCRACRRRERERKAAARRVHEDGLALKKARG